MKKSEDKITELLIALVIEANKVGHKASILSIMDFLHSVQDEVLETYGKDIHFYSYDGWWLSDEIQTCFDILRSNRVLTTWTHSLRITYECEYVPELGENAMSFAKRYIEHVKDFNVRRKIS